MSGTASTPTSTDGFRPFAMNDRVRTSNQHSGGTDNPTLTKVEDIIPRGRERQREGNGDLPTTPVRCINPASDVNSRLDTQVEVRVYPCNNSQGGGKKKFTTFTIKPEGVIIQGSNRSRNANTIDLGSEYAMHIGRKLQRYELSDTRACQLLVTTHAKNFWVVPAPEAFSRHSGTCRLLGDRKHPPAPHTLQVGDFLRVGSVGVVVIETHDGVENRVLSEEKIQKIMKDTTNTSGGFLDLAETDGENSEDSLEGETPAVNRSTMEMGDSPVCYMCFDEEDTESNPLITPCKCSGDTKYVHVECLRKWHTAEADNQICFLSSVDATCSVCKSTFKSDFKLRDGRQVKLFKSSLEPPYVSLLVATKHEMAQRLFNTRFQLSFSTLMKPDGRNATRPLLLGRSSGSDMVLDYRTVSARHAAIRFKNGEFVFTDAGSSNGSYLYLRRPLELSPSQSVQFRLGRSMISMKVVNKWNRRLLRAVRRTGQSGSRDNEDETGSDDRSIGSHDGDVRFTDGSTGVVTQNIARRTRESVMESMPPPGQLSQQSSKHLDLLYALAYPKKMEPKDASNRSGSMPRIKAEPEDDEAVSPSESGALSPAADDDKMEGDVIVENSEVPEVSS
ncbi:ring-variant domain containing protein [Nitzschia inconspicua]|uniref:Ring-variant domain containing protein n=1 Tax=Nitzschia inconspicua TaxID=303405 RepID=A0A9K3LR73_9STRA|nr:ring-variant domain containing protein [Nitzschia inconspicua]